MRRRRRLGGGGGGGGGKASLGDVTRLHLLALKSGSHILLSSTARPEATGSPDDTSRDIINGVRDGGDGVPRVSTSKKASGAGRGRLEARWGQQAVAGGGGRGFRV